MGDKVQLRADSKRRGLVRDLIETTTGYSYSVFFSADDDLIYAEHDLEPAIVRQSTGIQTHREFLRDLLLIKLRQPLTDNVYSLHASRTLFRVYQFKPALKFLDSPQQRILIADEVGLGKTIEAGIIYLEMKARFPVRRVLVVCPSGLRAKWHSELRSRFDEEFRVLDTIALRTFIEDFKRIGDAAEIKGICSIELLRRPEFSDAILDLGITFNLVVIDEAHHLRNATTLAHAMGEALADQSDALVLLTATPLHTGNADLFHLMKLIDPGEYVNLEDFEQRIRPNKFINRASHLVGLGEFHDALVELRQVEWTAVGQRFRNNPYYREAIALLERGYTPDRAEVVTLQRYLLDLNTLSHVFNRTRKREVADAAPRRAYTNEVEFSPSEREFYDNVVEFVRWQVTLNGSGPNAPMFTVITRERQAASCIQAVREQFEENLRTHHLTIEIEESGTDLDFGETDVHITEEARRRVDHLLSLCSALGETDTKFDRFVSAIRSILYEDPDAKILVFSFFRRTLAYLERRLRALHFDVDAIHGGVPLGLRMRIINEFRENPNRHILLSSEVGAEGLDFQFCGAMVNYDLPWNPMRVEQRIGRLDRFGQEHQVIQIINLVIADTIETRIFTRLYDRIGIFERSIGDLEAILGEAVRELSRDVFKSQLTPQEEIRLAEEATLRIERQRQEQEQFEEQRLVFLGQDELFAQELDTVITSGRYVAPDEVRSLVESYFHEAFPQIRLEANEADPTFTLTPTEDFCQEVERQIKRADVPRLVSQAFIQRLYRERIVPFTYDVTCARQRKLVEFLTINHPLARAACRYFLDRAPASAPFTALALPAFDGHEGDYAFFVYRLDIRCLSPQSTLVPILVSLRDNTIDSVPSVNFLANIQQLGTSPTPVVECSFERRAILRRLADEEMAGQVREREIMVRSRNDALVATRLASIEQSFSFRIENARRQMASVLDRRIVGMRKAQIRNLELALQRKKEEIEARREVSVGFEMIASGVVQFADLPTSESHPSSSRKSGRLGSEAKSIGQQVAESKPEYGVTRTSEMPNTDAAAVPSALVLPPRSLETIGRSSEQSPSFEVRVSPTDPMAIIPTASIPTNQGAVPQKKKLTMFERLRRLLGDK